MSRAARPTGFRGTLRWLLGRRVTPLRQLARATRAIAEGRWDAPLPTYAQGEIGQLTADFRAMVDALAKLDRENQRYRDHLEEMVEHRTRELEQAYQQVKLLAEAKGKFVAVVSHDFRSPLAIILSNVQTVLADPEMPAETRAKFLGRIERQCRRLGTLVNDLLDLARIEHYGPVYQQVELRALVAEELENQRSAFEEKRVQLLARTPDEPLVANVDPVLVTRALQNLLDNARKYTPEGGSVTVRLSREDAGIVRLSVQDTGPGIPESELEHVFDRFFQGDTGAALASGSGLGLAIVYGVALRHQGQVRVHSQRGDGATFELDIPLERGSNP